MDCNPVGRSHGKLGWAGDCRGWGTLGTDTMPWLGWLCHTSSGHGGWSCPGLEHLSPPGTLGAFCSFLSLLVTPIPRHIRMFLVDASY